jgi:hypothetical protein
VNRRELITLLSGAAAWPLTARGKNGWAPELWGLNRDCVGVGNGTASCKRRGVALTMIVGRLHCWGPSNDNQYGRS